MKLSTQKYLMILIAMAVTAFLAGGALVGWSLKQDYNEKLQSDEFLQKQLVRIQENKQEKAVAQILYKSVRTEKALRKKLGATRFFSGRLVEIQRALLAAETNGPVLEMPIEVGMPVKKNETLIAQIDPIWLKLASEQAKKQIAVSKVQLGFQEKEFERLQNLSAQGDGYVSASDLDSQKLKIEELQANIAFLEVTLTESERKLERSRILAPFDGSIVEKRSEVGAYVSPGSPLVEIVSTGQIDAELLVSEAFIDRLKTGQKVPIWIDSLNLEVIGEIHSIVPLGSTAARAFPVHIRLDDRQGSLKVGMSVRGKLQITDEKESIVVSKDAVLDRPDGAIIWVAVNPKDEKGNRIEKDLVAQPVQVVITARTDTQYAVIPIAQEGRDILQPGIDCVIEGADRLAVNEHLQIVSIDPELQKNLPKASGHTVISPIEDTAFYNPETNKVEEIKRTASKKDI